jgi:hypothetical protein
MGILPPAVEAVVRHCLAKYPIERPQTALDLAREYRRALGWPDDLDPKWFEPAVVMPEAGAEAPPPGSGLRQLVEKLEAWMPEPIAVVKLRGFIEDEGGRLVESVPGRIRMRLGEPPPEPPKQPALLSWLARRGQPPPPPEPPVEPVELDLYMTKKGTKPPIKLEITVVARALSGPLPIDPRWHKRFQKLLIDLRAYLMAQR